MLGTGSAFLSWGKVGIVLILWKLEEDEDGGTDEEEGFRVLEDEDGPLVDDEEDVRLTLPLLEGVGAISVDARPKVLMLGVRFLDPLGLEAVAELDPGFDEEMGAVDEALRVVVDDDAGLLEYGELAWATCTEPSSGTSLRLRTSALIVVGDNDSCGKDGTLQ